MATLPPIYYAVRMEAGMRYVFEIGVTGAGNAMEVSVRAEELNAEGETTRALQPARNESELQDCQPGAG